MSSSSAFDEAYGRLNPEQQGAVDAIDGPIFVIAGPGTGKTQILTLRIANILRQTDTPPDAILALTFTDAAVHEMRKRLTQIIGSRANRVRIHTFHGFAESIIYRFPDQFPRIIGSHIATDAERAELLDQLLLDTPVKHLRPYGDPLYYHSSVVRAISIIKREHVTPEILAERLQEEKESFEALPGKVHEKGKYAGQMKGEFITRQKSIERTEDLLALYRAYEEGLTRIKRYDYEDVILEVIQAFEHDEKFTLEVQESLLYVLADEHQDANKAQNMLLEYVSGFHERPNLFIVGDEKQAIYRFQGADLDNVHYFRSRFQDTKVITLVENYRSTQSILNGALSLIESSPDERLSRAPLIAHSEALAHPITIIECQTSNQEMTQLASGIKETIADGSTPNQIAVLVRRNKDVSRVMSALVREGIAVTGSGDENILHNRYVEALLRLLHAVVERSDDWVSRTLSLPGFGLSIADIARITTYARRERKSILSVLASKEDLEVAHVADIHSVLSIADTFQRLSTLSSYERPATVASEALTVSGLLPRALEAADREEVLAAIRGVISELEELSIREHGVLMPRALELFNLYEARGIALSGSGRSEDSTKVQVMTVHRSKGREFERVFIPLMDSRAWSTRSRTEFFVLRDVFANSTELEDERRLFYVALTRAMRRITISYASTSEDGRNQERADLIDELAPELVEIVSATASANEWLEELPNALSKHTDGPNNDDLATLRSIFLSQGLSSTALNNYLECHWKYFYVNLLRIPDAENKFMLYGTAIHNALRRFADAKARSTEMGSEALVAVFTSSLDRLPLSPREIDELQEKGIRALTMWWDERHTSWPEQARAEELREANIVLSEETSLMLRGMLDLVYEVSGGYTVIDYKTGSAKSRNELMGLTKNANGNYYRQLTFYKLLLERAEQPQHMHEGIIEFVEPDEKNRIRTEAFSISDAEVRDLETQIQDVAEKILILSFWNERCDDERCTWCRLRFSLTK